MSRPRFNPKRFNLLPLSSFGHTESNPVEIVEALGAIPITPIATSKYVHSMLVLDRNSRV